MQVAQLAGYGGDGDHGKSPSLYGTTTTWFVGQAAHIGRFMVHVR